MINKENDELEKAEQVLLGDLFEKAEFSTKERKNLAKKKLAMPDGSYPIRNVSDLKNAIQAFGRTGSNKSETKSWIKRRAKELGKEDLLPDTWKSQEIDILGIDMDLQKAEDLLLSDLFEKAHNPGDIHPNGKWEWRKTPTGYDWRVIKKDKKHSESKGSGDSEDTEKNKNNLDSYASKTSTENLKKVISSKKATKKMKDVAKKELEKRENKEKYKTPLKINVNGLEFTKLDNGKYSEMIGGNTKEEILNLIKEYKVNIENIKTYQKKLKFVSNSRLESDNRHIIDIESKIEKLEKEAKQLKEKEFTYSELMDLNNKRVK